MTIKVNVFDTDNNGTGIKVIQYLKENFASFDKVEGTLSTDADVSEYAFIGTDGGGVIFHSSTGWTVDPDSGDVVGTLDSVSFGQQTSAALDGTFGQTADMTISGIDVSVSDLQSIFDQAPDGNFFELYLALRNDAFSIVGSSGKDSLVGGYGSSVIRGGAGNDIIYGNGGDRLIGGDGNDKIIGSGAADVVYGGNGDDVISSKSGNDVIRGGAGNDIVAGDYGNDKLYGDSGDDIVSGGRGEDRLYGGTGNDRLTGGTSADVFVFQKNAGDDIISDFVPGKAGKDLIFFHHVGLNSFAEVLDHAADTKDGVLITYDEGTLLLERVKVTQLDSHDFLFS